MIIAIPVQEKSMESKVNDTFGRTPYFLIYNSETKEGNFIDNSAANASGGAGIKAAQLLADNKADCTISPRLGTNASEVLNLSKIKVYESIKATVSENITALVNEELKLLSEIHEGFHSNK